jgi:hypothetical protein
MENMNTENLKGAVRSLELAVEANKLLEKIDGAD